jgi:hypothetical protein
VAAALQAVGLSGVLNGLKIVRHRNDREEDEKKQSQGDELSAPVCNANSGSAVSEGARGRSPPLTEGEGGQKNPRKIEENLHSQG